VADDGSPPASVEFGRVLAEERLGRPLHEAIEAMCQRVGSEDLDYVATAINVQSQAGGSLATLFDTLSETVRERQRHARKVRALTSMGRMSATILVCLPFALAALMTFVNPGYMKPFYTTSTGQTLIVICLISMSTGPLLLKKIVRVKYGHGATADNWNRLSGALRLPADTRENGHRAGAGASPEERARARRRSSVAGRGVTAVARSHPLRAV